MPRYIDAEKLAEHKFPGVTYDRYVSDGRLKNEEEICAYKVGYNEAIDDIAQFATTADVVEIKTGNWILKKISEDRYGNVKYRYFCSECGEAAYKIFQKYCHECGRKMKGIKHE